MRTNRTQFVGRKPFEEIVYTKTIWEYCTEFEDIALEYGGQENTARKSFLPGGLKQIITISV